MLPRHGERNLNYLMIVDITCTGVKRLNTSFGVFVDSEVLFVLDIQVSLQLAPLRDVMGFVFQELLFPGHSQWLSLLFL